MLNRISILTLIVLGIAALATPTVASAQTTWHVDDDAPNDPSPGDPTVSDPLEDGSPEHPFDAIQEGIDAASNGDEVVVCDGTYTGAGNKDIDFSNDLPPGETRAITVRSENGRENCVVDCEGDARGFYFHSAESDTSRVEGFTISNGSLSGGGVLCDWSSPAISDCTISGNSADENGGGIWCVYSSPTISDCTISNNSAGYGGGVNCVGISSPTITNCTISNNNSAVGGGAVCCNSYSSPTLTNCTIANNSAGYGAGVYCMNTSSPTITSCTISNNNSAVEGGAVCCTSYSSPTISDCILWGDTPEEIYVSSSSPVVTYCDVQGDWSGEGNIDADPLFIDIDGPDDDPNTWEDNDYRLSSGSPCIDAGDNTAVPLDICDLDEDGDTDERIPFDLDGNPRFVQDPFTPDTGVPDPPRYRHIVDMGAYEFQFCFGDLDGDDDIDIADLAQLLGSYGETAGMTYYDGDLDDDGDVDLADLAELLGAYGDVCS